MSSADTTLFAAPLATTAQALLAEVAADPGKRIIASVVGARGSGRSDLLAALTDVYLRSGIPVRHGSEFDPPHGVLIVDDAHLLGPGLLEAVLGEVGRSEMSAIVGFGPWHADSSLSDFASPLGVPHRSVSLGALNRGEIARILATSTGSGLSSAQLAEIAETVETSTAGTPWLVTRFTGILRAHGSRIDAARAEQELIAALVPEVAALPADVHELLLALAVGFDVADRPPPIENTESGRIVDRIADAQNAGLLTADGRVPNALREAAIQSSPTFQVRALQRAFIDVASADQTLPIEAARGLARTGIEDDRVAAVLLSFADESLLVDPALAADVYSESVAAGADPAEIAARRAQAALALGNFDEAEKLIESSLRSPEHADAARATDVAAALWSHRGMTSRSVETYRWSGLEGLGSSTPLAVVAMLATGEVESADRLLVDTSMDRSPTLHEVAIALFASGTRESLRQRPGRALSSLIRASDTFTASRAQLPLPELPAAVAAFVAINAGELDVAASVLDAARGGDQGGPMGRRRLLLLSGWVAMLTDRPDLAREAIDDASKSALEVVPRDGLLSAALEVALARRLDDTAALLQAWRKARTILLHVPIDLFALLPLGELVIAAARLREDDRVDAALEDAWTLLGRLSDAPLWSIPLRWACIQAGLLSDKPDRLGPHAAALVGHSSQSTMAAALATAGRAWVSVLAEKFEPDTVIQAARGLALVGRTWDGARLAGHAAAHVENRQDMARLLACARDLHPGSGAVSTRTAPIATIAPHERVVGQPELELSDRERDVAALFVEGKSYREIGEAIFISPRTVEHHMARIRQRLDATSKSEVLLRLRRLLSEAGESRGNSGSAS